MNTSRRPDPAHIKRIQSNIVHVTKIAQLSGSPLLPLIPSPRVSPMSLQKLAPCATRRFMPKRKASFLIPEELYQEARDAVAFLGGPPLYLTLAQLAEDALRDKLDELKEQHNKGKPFPRFAGRVKTGRPMGIS